MNSVDHSILGIMNIKKETLTVIKDFHPNQRACRLVIPKLENWSEATLLGITQKKQVKLKRDFWTARNKLEQLEFFKAVVSQKAFTVIRKERMKANKKDYKKIQSNLFLQAMLRRNIGLLKLRWIGSSLKVRNLHCNEF